ncbi:MAG: response regulator transcription factor [Actinobacteria bacterium]|nr:response regulator transcription factor [Actinomycetota bacterium]
MTRVLVADDHQLLRNALRRALEDSGFTVISEAANGADALRLAQLLHPDVVVMDVTMPVLDGIEATRRIHADDASTRVLVLTMHDEDALRARAIQAGAVGFLTKDCALHDLVDAVRDAAAGEITLTPQIATSMMVQFGEPDALEAANGSWVSPLTPRELEILQAVADGSSTSEIACDLFISAKTVKNHLASIFAKLDSRDRLQAVLSGMRLGIVQLQ